MGGFTWVVGILPVLLLLVGLRLIDSYKLVSPRAVAVSFGMGVVAAGLAFLANVGLLRAGLDEALLRRFLAPVIEESLKAVWVVVLLRRARIGFLVDAGIHGFAIGTGFAVVENLYYASALGRSAMSFWLVRGLGTAVLHGGTTAILAILTQSLAERRGGGGALWAVVPGFAIAVVAHSLYNQLLWSPLLATAAILLAMPLLLFAVYERSERATRDWLGTGLDSDVERLELILSGEERHTPIGEYLESLRHRFDGPVLADMLCLLRIHLELSLRAKGMLIARAAGLDIPHDASVQANLDELRFLERSIGKTGRLALLPLLGTGQRELWQVYLLHR
jgi:RsiW-degrading membrane proteinase PrsW (M82 family)